MRINTLDPNGSSFQRSLNRSVCSDSQGFKQDNPGSSLSAGAGTSCGGVRGGMVCRGDEDVKPGTGRLHT